MKCILKLDDGERCGEGPMLGNGPIFKYHVLGVPGLRPDEEPQITNSGNPNRPDWQIRRSGQNTFTGHHKSAEVALAVLQKDYE
jgi:hypothetical protein